MKVTEKVEEEERRKAQLRESQVALSKKLEELRIQSRSTAREGLMLRHQVSALQIDLCPKRELTLQFTTS